MIPQTPCECSGAGYCTRHNCVKSDWLYHQCRRNMRAFTSWEEGRGQCLPIPPDAEDESCPEGETAGPGLLRRTINFGAAIARHAANQMRNVEPSSYETRLSICRQCPSCDLERMVCRELTCGCFLQTKARWESEKCPLQKWPDAPKRRESSFG